MTCKIQLALDTLDYDHALYLAHIISPWVDILEAGTPLIKSVGIQIVSRLREEFPDKLILADLKSSDVGGYEAEMAFKAGADIVTTQGITTLATIREVQSEANKWGRRCEVDLTGVADPIARTREIKALGVSLVLCHRSIDEEVTKGSLWNEEALKTLGGLCDLEIDVAIAGGINLEVLDRFAKFPLYGIVVGRGITAQSDPAAAAQAIIQRVKELW
ncbi:MAG: orotidine 5'-phosphate decarboxylase / HUMPS family protein [Chloroflexota bacterium]